MTRRSLHLHLPLAAAAVVLVVLGLLVASGAGAAEVAPLNVVDREAFAAGAAAAVEFQTAPLPDGPPTDDLTRAQCRWRFDGTNPPAARERRTAFLAGCDEMTVRTDLERR